MDVVSLKSVLTIKKIVDFYKRNNYHFVDIDNITDRSTRKENEL